MVIRICKAALASSSESRTEVRPQHRETSTCGNMLQVRNPFTDHAEPREDKPQDGI
jgi:hypothetical protein